MTIAKDAVTDRTGTSDTADYNFTHTPSGAPKGVLVLIQQGGSSTPETVTVTYGGESLSQTPQSPATGVGSGSDSNSVIYGFFLGTGLPTSAQTVAVTKSGSDGFRTLVITLTAVGDTVVQDDDASISSTSLANPSATLALGGKNSFCAEAFKSGHNNVANITPLTDWTDDAEVDLGSNTIGWYTYDIVGTSDVTMGWTQTAEDATCLGVAMTESAAAGTRRYRVSSY